MNRLIPNLVFVATLSVSAHLFADNLKFMELYTSHGCSSCPPAESLFAELLQEHNDLVALEFHVDYWNTLIHGSDGNFVDPFSNAEYSARQREYSVANLKGRPGVYTPQTIVNGRFAAVGSSRRSIEKALASPVEQVLSVRIKPADDQSVLRIIVTGNQDQLVALEGVDILLARYLDRATTKITGGENRHLELENHHIVTDLQRLGAITANAIMEFEVQGPGQGRGCVVFVQEDALTPVYAATACP